MKNYTITVNGNVYDVTVEENGQGAAYTAPRVAPAAPRVAPVASAPAAAAPVAPQPAPQAAPAAAPAPAPGGEGSIKIEAGAAGKVFKIESSVGAQVKLGDPIVVLEIMKMETPVVAPKDGVVASINVSEGQNVEAGELLATMNE